MPALAQPVSLASFATFGDLLKFLRRRERLTQLDLSIAVGYSEAQISRLEKNQRLPDLTALKALFIPALHLDQEPAFAARFLELAQSARAEDAPAPGIAPYKGLLCFDLPDAEWFFGREALTARLAARVHALGQGLPAPSKEEGQGLRLFAIVGASGSGKSSIVRAGLAVALEQAGWDVHVFTPTAQPLKMLETQFASAATDHAHKLAIVDQFEEVFTLCRDETLRAAFVEKLLAAANEPHGAWSIVLALRADFYSHCAQYPPLRQAIAAQQEYIGQMTADELRRAIEEPARRGGWEFQPGLVELMLRDIGAFGTQDQEPGALPLLSHALLATWERRRGRTMTLEGYRASGGVRGAIAETAESVYTDQFNPTQQQFAREIFMRLTELGEGTEDTRRRAALTELVPRAEQAAALRAVLNLLADARLVSLGEDSAEVAHEALIREWQRLREWLNEDRESLRLHRQLTEAAREWTLLERDAGALYRGARLAQAREFAQANPDALNEPERAFLQASQEQETRESREKEELRQRELEAARKLAETEQRANTQLRRRAVFLAGAFLLAIFLAGLALFFGEQARVSAVSAQANAADAQRQGRVASARAFAASAINNLGLDPQRSILLALQAVAATEPDQTTLPEAEDALHRAVMASHVQAQLPYYSSSDQAPPRDAHRTFRSAFSPDGSRLALRGPGVFKILDAKTWKEQVNLSVGPTFGAYAVAYSPDGSQIATLDHDASETETLVKIFDAGSGKLVRTSRIPLNWDAVMGAGFSPDLARVVLLPFGDIPVHIWDSSTGQSLTELGVTVGNDFYPSAVFSPDGKRLALTTYDSQVKILDVATGKQILTLCCHQPWALQVAFSPDEKRIATTGWDYKIKLWDAETGKELNSLAGHSNIVTDVAWSPDGGRFASTSWDRKAIEWEAATGKLLYELPGHGDFIDDATFSPDGKTLVTASEDKSAMVWDVGPSREVLAVQQPYALLPAGYNADRKHFATVDAHGEVKIWDAKTLQSLQTLDSNIEISGFGQLILSPDQKLVAAGTQPTTMTVWDLTSGKQIFTLTPGKDGFATGASFSPDSSRLAVAFNDAQGPQVGIWDSRSGKPLATLVLASQPGTFLQGVVWSPDSKRIVASYANGTVQVWIASTGTFLFQLAGHTNYIWHVLYSPDGSKIATASRDGMTIVYRADSGAELVRLVGHTSTVDSLDWSPDGTRIVSAGSDGTARIWDVETGTELVTLNQGPYPVEGAIFTADGKHVITTSDDGALREYTLDVNELVDLAKARLIRTWTPEECHKFLHLDACPQ